MTGAEFAAAAGAAATKVGVEVVKAAKEENAAIGGLLLDSAQGTAGMDAAGEVFGRRQAVKQEILLKLYQPVARLLGVSRTYFETEFAADMADTMRDIPMGNIRTPRASVAGPAMQAMTFALDEPDLKQLFLELLATASDSRVAGSAHPSFVDILRQLTAEEAVLLRIYLSKRLPLAQVEWLLQPGGGVVVRDKHIAETRDSTGVLEAVPYFDTFVDNWNRLGLINYGYDRTMSRESLYDWVDQHPTVVSAFAYARALDVTELDEVDLLTPQISRGYIEPSVYGKQFSAAVGMSAKA